LHPSKINMILGKKLCNSVKNNYPVKLSDF
jgi:hypothetical protein